MKHLDEVSKAQNARDATKDSRYKDITKLMGHADKLRL